MLRSIKRHLNRALVPPWPSQTNPHRYEPTPPPQGHHPPGWATPAAIVWPTPTTHFALSVVLI